MQHIKTTIIKTACRHCWLALALAVLPLTAYAIASRAMHSVAIHLTARQSLNFRLC